MAHRNRLLNTTSRFITVCCLLAPTLFLSAATAKPESSGPNLRQVGSYTIDSRPLTQDLGGGVMATIDRGTQLKILPATYIKLHPSKPATRCATIELVSGRIEVSVPPGSPPANSVMIQTVTALSAVPLGGKAIAVVSDKGFTAANVDGELLVGKGITWEQVKPGVARSFSSGASASARPILGVPSIQVRDLFLLAPVGAGTSTMVEVSGETMKRFEVSVSKLDTGANEQVMTYTSTGAPVEISGLSAGRYQVVARGFDEWGLSHGRSEPATLNVMSYELPKEAHVVDGRVHLLPGQRIVVHGSKDLEMTYGAQSRYFVPLPADVGLGGLSSEVARFRVKGSTVEARLSLVARPFQAHIEVNPSTAHWPGDLVQVSIRLTNHAGRLAPQAPEVAKVVKINARPVKLNWRNQQGVLVANLPPQPGNGPWKVQVELKDKLGTFATHSSELRARPARAGG